MSTATRRVCSSAIIGLLVFLAASMAVAPPARGAGVLVTDTGDASSLQAALNAAGLTITSVTIVNGVAARPGVSGQFGTYTNFATPPVTIGDGIVLSSGRVSAVVAPPDPPSVPVGSPTQSYNMGAPGTPEFDAYGPGHVQGFVSGSHDVAALQVDFTLATDSRIKFDFVFGSVEYPYYTSAFTDAFLVFLDGTDAANQITFDTYGNPIQVGDSFAGLETTADQNTAFAGQHGLLPRLTTTSGVLSAGKHTLLFEVGDVNDGVLDSAAFIADLRTGGGREGTEIENIPTPQALWAGVALLPLVMAWRMRREMALR